MMTNKTIVIIRNFVSIEGEPYIVGCSFLDACDLFTAPIESSRLDIYKLSILSEELQLWPLKSVWKKCFLLPRPSMNNSFAIIPLLNEDVTFH